MLFNDRLIYKICICVVGMSFANIYNLHAESQIGLFDINCTEYLYKHDIVYQSPLEDGFEGFPLGNGDMGTMIWTAEQGYRLQINKNDTWDLPETGVTMGNPMSLRSCGQLSIDFQSPCHNWLYLDDFEGRLSLGKAEASFKTTTPFIDIQSECRVLSDKNIFLMNCVVTNKSDSGIVRIALERWGSRTFPFWYQGIARNASKGLGKAKAGINDNTIWIEESFNGVSFTMACRVISTVSSDTKLIHNNRAEIELSGHDKYNFKILVAVVTSNESEEPLAAAIALLDDFSATSAEKQHAAWWSDFWQRSFVSIGDDYVENLYYMHMYLMASSSRGEYPSLFNGSLFIWNHDVRNWGNPHHWNTQQAYWSMGAANHTELMLPYLNTYWRLMPYAEEYAEKRGMTNAILWSEAHDFAGNMFPFKNSENCFTPALQIGQLFWDYYQYTGDTDFLKDRAYPFIKKAAEFYLQYMKWNEENKQYDIYPSSSYEAHLDGESDWRNNITDLAMLRVTLQRCIDASIILNVDVGKRSEWEMTLSKLYPYLLEERDGVGEVFVLALDKEGEVVHINKNRESSFCRLTSPVFPSGDIDLAQKGSRYFNAAVRCAKMHPEHKLAISPKSVVKARLGMGELALKDLLTSIRQLQHFPQGQFYNLDHWHYLSRYADKVDDPWFICQRDYIYDTRIRYSLKMGKTKLNIYARPFIQSGQEPLSILATTVNEMLLQSHNGIIRVLPAVPKSWSPSFTLRARGGFMVSATGEKNNKTKFIIIKSLIGNNCRLANPWPKNKVQVYILKDHKLESYPCSVDDNKIISFATEKDHTYWISPKENIGFYDKMPKFTSRPNDKLKRYKEASLGKARNF